MKNTHEKLSKKYAWYNTWHTRRTSSAYHWFTLVFFIAVLIFASPLYLNNRETINPELASLKGVPSFSGKAAATPTDQVIIGFRDDVTPAQTSDILTGNNFKKVTEIRSLHLSAVKIPPGQTSDDAMSFLKRKYPDQIDFVEPDAVIAPAFIPNDPNYQSEWHHTTINSPTAWDTTSGNGVIIAIADTGVDQSHPDLIPHLIPGWNVYSNTADTNDVMGHGTAVAGAAAATGNNGVEIAGVAYGASLMPIRVSDAQGNASYSAIAQGITYAADHGAKIVNVSYMVGNSRSVDRAAKYMKQKGGLTVIAEGNTGANIQTPGSASMISVGATDNYDLKATWSTYGQDMDVVAPGQAIFSTAKGGGTDYWSGTSFSAPITAGILALVWGANPALTPDDVMNVLLKSAIDLGTPGWDELYGWGRIDAGKAVSTALQTTPTTPTTLANPGKKK